MKNIFEIMKEYGLEVAEDKKKDFEKLVLDNYKTVSDYETQAEKLKTAEGKVTTLTENLDKFKDVNVDELNNTITTLKADLENKDKELKDKLADRDFNDLLRESIAGANGKNAKAITALLDVENLKTSKNQKDDIADALKKLAEAEDSKMLFGEQEEVSDYDKANGIKAGTSGTTYEIMPIDKDKAVNEIIDGYDAKSVPDNLVADRLDSAGYSLAKQIDTDGGLILVAGATVKNEATLTPENIYDKIVDIKTDMDKANIPNDGKRYLLVLPDTMALILKDKDHFVKASDLGDAVVQTGAVGKIAGFLVIEWNDSTANLAMVAGHPRFATRAKEFSVPVHIQDLSGSGQYIGASAVQGRNVYAHKVLRTGYDINDRKNGFAGDLVNEIDAVMMYYVTPDALHRAIGGCKKAKYSVSVDKNSNFYSWQYDNETVTSPEGKKQDGYAGTYGKPIDGLYLSIV